MENTIITSVTRRNIADQLIVGGFLYHGRLEEPEFLARVFPLQDMPSHDGRYKNAYDDIWKHMVMNQDWAKNWVFTDRRLNLLHGPDETYLRFLAETIHPAVRSNEEEVQELLAMYNKALAADGFELLAIDEISGHPVFQGHRRLDGNGTLQEQKKAIRQYLDGEYIQQRLSLMHRTVHTQTDVAIGLAKELLETTCQSILHQKGHPIDKEWSVNRLLKETVGTLDFTSKGANEPQKAEASIKQVLAGLNTTVQGITELRNSYGSGHGKVADFKGLEPKYAKFIVSVVGEVCLLLLATSHSSIELVEVNEHPPEEAIPANATQIDDLPF